MLLMTTDRFQTDFLVFEIQIKIRSGSKTAV